VLAHSRFDHIDFGYGTPHAEFRSTHVLQTRGLFLLHRAHGRTAWLLNVHGRYAALNDALIGLVKRVQKWHARRRPTVIVAAPPHQSKMTHE
jgi:uncharacterized protein YecE (DUF72 family)